MSARPDNDTLLAHVEAARHGDDVALGQLVRATQPIVWRFCANLTTREDADDVCQDVFIRAARNLRQYRGDAPVLAWLLSIARRACADQVRRNQRRARLGARLRGERTAALPDGHGIDLVEFVGLLDPDRREAFVLTQIIGLSYDEAAAACECPIGTIRSRVARARVDLVEMVRSAEAV